MKKIYEMELNERINYVKRELGLSDDDTKILLESLKIEDAEKLIENVIGVYKLPLGIATNFIVNGRKVLVPMVIEESSVVAAASNGAKFASYSGGFKASFSENVTVGQIQLVCKNPAQALKTLKKNKKEIGALVNEVSESMVRRGGGIRKLEFKRFGKYVVVYVFYDTVDAMGANTINTICEKIAPHLSELTKSKYVLRIISNYAPEKIARAQATFKKEILGKDLIESILDAYELAKKDIRRAVTHNKGIMNGIDAVAIATGQDWRAIEAGAHSYACKNGKYQPLTTWQKTKSGDLIGKIEIPIQVGIVGGITNIHPTAKLCLKMMGVKKVGELAEIMACVGLANNFAALRALASEGIQKGHMKLHAINLAMSVGAGELSKEVARRMIESGEISAEKAKEILKKLKNKIQ
ncbi:MAG: hydroxymethylglutaryl-CoA reductase, degradative [Candidatus Micrarchaeia archaeon]